jgi:hypothetical protein
MNNTRRNAKTPNRGRHEAECRICRHEKRNDIDRAFINWRSPEESFRVDIGDAGELSIRVSNTNQIVTDPAEALLRLFLEAL